MVHGVKIAVTGHGHVQGINGNGGFGGNDRSSGGAAVDFGEECGNIVVADFLDQFDQFRGGGLTAGFFFHGAQDLQTKAVSEVGETVVECDQFPAGNACKFSLSIDAERFQFGAELHEIGIEDLGILRIAADQTVADIQSHGRSQVGGEPDVRIFLVMVSLVGFFLFFVMFVVMFLMVMAATTIVMFIVFVVMLFMVVSTFTFVMIVVVFMMMFLMFLFVLF